MLQRQALLYFLKCPGPWCFCFAIDERYSKYAGMQAIVPLTFGRHVPIIADKVACRYFLLESGFALFVALLINIAVIAISGTVCHASNLSADNIENCSDLTLNSASFLLKNVLGKSSATVYVIALLASGQSSTITGTYAGQYIMQGFLDIKMRNWLRNLLTRCIAIAPSLIVSIIGGSAGAGRLIIISSVLNILPQIVLVLVHGTECRESCLGDGSSRSRSTNL